MDKVGVKTENEERTNGFQGLNSNPNPGKNIQKKRSPLNTEQ